MRHWARWLLLGVLAAILGGCSTTSVESLQTESDKFPEPPLPAFVLSPATEFTLASADGQALHLAAWRGRSPLVLSFFTTDCHGCAAELPHLVSLYGNCARQGLKMVMVSPEPLAQLQAYALQRRLPFPVLADPQRELHRAYGASGTPYTLLIDPNGKVVKAMGAYTAEMHFDDEFVPFVAKELRRTAPLGR